MAHLQGKLSLIMPAYNEGERIFENLHLAVEQVLPLADEVELIVVDDGSSDDTLQEIRRAAQTEPRIRAIHSPRNEGKGNALRLGRPPQRGRTSPFAMRIWTLPPPSWTGSSRFCRRKMPMRSSAARCIPSPMWIIP